ncbi:hypothetical protein E4U31_003251 [Claviceps sp. LM219 group G6]|nr:hypothetical protein E4U15_004725 [Claviceps sp. LM218 group G6]KAG6102899.1 hypothetical protein E4U31_003251 [Claviceps sp. LM219 group G6]KAG6122320.1 hypothetical protein E4U14_007784 [Claviceps sp. LM454 group G7]
MFSEYASRFLAQSQSRLSGFAGQAGDNDDTQRTHHDWPSTRLGRGGQRDTGRASTAPHRSSFVTRGYGGSPYHQNGTGSRFGNLGFASRISAAQDAPLFHSTVDEFREEDDHDEREREAADLFALQRSRRVAAASQLGDSTESANTHGSVGDSAIREEHCAGRGIRSSWDGKRSSHQPYVTDEALLDEAKTKGLPQSRDESRSPEAGPSTLGKGKMVDVGLESQEDGEDDGDDGDDDPPESLLGGEAPTEHSPPPFQRFKGGHAEEQDPFIPRRLSTSGSDDASSQRRPSYGMNEMNRRAAQHGDYAMEGELFRHDPFFAWIFLISFAAMLSTYILVWLHTSPQSSPVGDTIYATLQKSFDMLAIDTVVAVFVSFIWLAALRSYVRPLVTLILVAVPIIMFSFSMYSFSSSFKGRTHGSSLQDTLMRWTALLPAAACILWLWLIVQARRAIQQAIEILQFSSKILSQNAGLLLIGFGCLALIVIWTWLWLAMFTRVFMGGYFSKSLVRFVIRLSSWWLGAAFILMYMWTLAVVNAVHRATTAATVSQWYFHRNAGPVTPSREIVAAALSHATTTVFGSICESTLLSLLMRAPLLFLPSRIGTALANIAAFWIPTPVVALTNPLTVTYVAIHSQSLAVSARGLDQMDIVSTSVPTTTLTPRALRLSGGRPSSLLAYRLAKLLLVATRLIMATGLGFAGWVMTAKQMQIQLPDGMGVRGSAYAYVVGIMASFIGYSVMGAMEGILSGIVDAVLICYGSERRMEGGHGRYCLEAAYLFGGRRGENLGYAYS